MEKSDLYISNKDAERMKINLPPPIVGFYVMNQGYMYTHRFGLSHKPNWFNRKMTKFFLGWEWEDDRKKRS